MNQSYYTTGQDLYENCKSALAGQFKGSFCAAYIEGYVQGGGAISLYMLSLVDNQMDIIEDLKKKPCANIDYHVKNRERVRWVAEYFTDWMENNQEIIQSESAFLNREAATMLHVISTDERFCLKSNLIKEEKP